MFRIREISILHLSEKLANKIMNRIMEACEKEINCTRLAAAVGKPRTSITVKVNSKREWDAGTWLACAWALGFCHYKDGEIRMKVKLLEHEIAKLESMRTKDIFSFKRPLAEPSDDPSSSEKNAC